MLMALTLLDQVARLQQEFRLMRMTVETLQKRMDELVTSLQEQARAEGRSVLFTDLEGIWEGTDLSREEIKAAEYQLSENLP
jgi:hypothetical protein